MVQALLERVPELQLAVSATTRPQRPGETTGVHYWFVSDGDFDRKLEEGDFLETFLFPWVHRSGTLLSELERISAAGRVPLLELELNGSLAVKERVPHAVTIFVDAPLEELERRLRDRATESAGEIGERIELARGQKELAGRFDYVVENDDRERAAAECVELVRKELRDAATMARP
jgi:guanylate kinase